jgi:multiple sugar transport system substrate-binding protein
MLLLMFALTACMGGGGGGGQTTGENETADSSPAADNNGGGETDSNSGGESTLDPAEVYVPTSDPNLEANLTIWAGDVNKLEPVVEAFQKHYPKIKVDLVSQGLVVAQKAQTAIAAGRGGPDIISYHFNDQGLFNNGAGLENLLDPPYNAGRFKDAFTEANWYRWSSLDGQKLYSMPFEHVPTMLFYRADILEQYGYPTDPEELAEYLSDTENYLDMAMTFKEDGMYMFTIKDWEMISYLGDRGFFDENLNYARTEDKLVEILDLMKRQNQLGLIPNLLPVWDEEANQALNSGKLIMVEVESTFSRVLREIAPDTAGKWRATRLPTGYSAQQGITMSILSQSKNKEAAWAFIEFAFATFEGQKALIDSRRIDMVGFKPMWQLPEYRDYKEDFLGGQEINKISMELLEKAPMSRPTPLDAKAKEIWIQGILDAIDKNMDSRAALQKIREDIEAAVSQDRQKLLEAMGK